MKQTIEIDVPEGKTAVWKDGKVIFEDIDFPNTWEGFCSIEREKPLYYISDVNSRIFCVTKKTLDPIQDRYLLPSKNTAIQHRALMQLHQLRDCYRQGWFPDYENNEYKYKIVCDEKLGLITIKDKSSWTSPFLVFQSEEIAEKFLNNFRELIRTAGDLIVS